MKTGLDLGPLAADVERNGIDALPEFQPKPARKGRPQTQNAGASLNRQDTVAWIKRHWPCTKAQLLEYLAGQPARATNRAGGPGRPKKAARKAV